MNEDSSYERGKEEDKNSGEKVAENLTSMMNAPETAEEAQEREESRRSGRTKWLLGIINALVAFFGSFGFVTVAMGLMKDMSKISSDAVIGSVIPAGIIALSFILIAVKAKDRHKKSYYAWVVGGICVGAAFSVLYFLAAFGMI